MKKKGFATSAILYTILLLFLVLLVGILNNLQNRKMILDTLKEQTKQELENRKEKLEDNQYYEKLLNGAYPELKEGLIPVTIEKDGTVKKADLTKEWYSYEKKEWANAVILKDETKTYKEEAIIPESNIESYFVWIPKYSYQIWDLGQYSSITKEDGKKVHEIPIVFGSTNTNDEIEDECTTPMNENKTQGLAGETGKCQVGDYMTHPAFIAFNVKGFWVGKFETGYDGANSTTTAQVNNNDFSKIIIKPNVYSWRNISVGNAFKASYDYKREFNSHMMKNTEWGAVTYLQYSKYGSNTTKVRINNNNSMITGYASTEEPTKGQSVNSISGNRHESTALNKDGTYTKMYNTETGYLASTTRNITGIYDLNGGAIEYTTGYTTSANSIGGSSGITLLYSDFFTNKQWEPYYDKYTAKNNTQYNNRILGDATGEMGPIGQATVSSADNVVRPFTSWYYDCFCFVTNTGPWFRRGGHVNNGAIAGIVAADGNDGAATDGISFRIVLAWNK